MNFKKFFSSELGRGSLILFIMINIFNFFNFLFHFSMGRLLGPANYGILAVLMSLIYIYGIPSEAIQTLISKYTSNLNIKKEHNKIKFLMVNSFSKGFKISIFLFILLNILAIFISSFLKINYWLIFTTNILILFFILSPIIRGILQGRKKFALLGTSMIIESGVKLFIAILLVILGFKIFGALIGILIVTLLGFVFSIYFNKNIIKQEKQKTTFNNIYSKSIPYFMTMFIILVMFSLDIILAKRFFSAELAGQYSVLSMLGKMIFFGTIAISKAMFPIASEKHKNNLNSKELFKKSILTISALCFIVVMIYYIFPELVIKLLYGNQYIGVKDYLVYSGLALSFLSLSNLVLIYGLSINKLKKSYYLGIFLLLEIILLSLFHKTILEYILAFMVSNIIMFIGSLFLVRK